MPNLQENLAEQCCIERFKRSLLIYTESNELFYMDDENYAKDSVAVIDFHKFKKNCENFSQFFFLVFAYYRFLPYAVPT